MNKPDYFIDVKSSFTREIAKLSPDEIALEYSYMTLTRHLMLMSEIFNKADLELKGVGMEVASGAAVFPSSLCRIFPNITKIYAYEIVEEAVKSLQPKIIAASHLEDVIIPMVGDFNDIKFPDNSFDFVVGLSSLHHSNDLKKTISEIGRVLKPGGRMAVIDRALPNYISKSQIDFLLNKDYSREYKIKHGIDPNKPYRRYEEGEHEPRLKDWEEAFKGSGLELEPIKIFIQRNFKIFAFLLISLIPFFIRKALNFYPSLVFNQKIMLLYLFPYLAKKGKLQVYQLHGLYKNPHYSGMQHMLITATKKH